MIKAVLFDLDGTLLPMDDEIFIKDYFAALVKKVSTHGYDPDQLVSGIWKATKSMMTNCLINKEDKDISNYPSGSYDDLIKYIDSLSK